MYLLRRMILNYCRDFWRVLWITLYKPQALLLVTCCSLIHFEYQSNKLISVCARFYFTKDYKRHSRLYKNIWHVGPLLGNDREINNYTKVVARKWLCEQRPLLGNDCNIHPHNNRTVGSGVFFTVLPRMYNERQSETAVRRIESWCEMAASLQCCEPGSRGTSTGEDTADWEDLAHGAVNCKLCELAIAL
jgi:hypothetical protein